MIKKLLVFIPVAFAVGALSVHTGVIPISAISSIQQAYAQQRVLAEDEMSLTNRYRVPFVSEVFADNILLTLSYMSKRVDDPQHIDWEKVRDEQTHEILLKPGEVFAFHDGVMAKYASDVVMTTNAHFDAGDGFRSSGYLYGDGVCHLASLFNRAATKAGLMVDAPVNHNFAVIPDISREFGTSIYYAPNQQSVSEKQNLYIKNTFDKTVKFVIVSDSQKVAVTIVEER